MKTQYNETKLLGICSRLDQIIAELMDHKTSLKTASKSETVGIIAAVQKLNKELDGLIETVKKC